MKQKIVFEVELGDNKIPKAITWSQEGNEGVDTKAILISIFERKTKETLRMDLWTQDMEMMEMDRLFYHTMMSMAQTYFNATKNKEMSEDMRNFAKYFGEKTEILKKNPE